LSEVYYAKGTESLHELVPGAGSVALLITTNPTAALAIRETQNAALTLGLRLTVLQASSANEIEQAFAIIDRDRIAGVLVDGNRLFLGQIDQLVALAARRHVPAIYSFREYVQAGGLMSYGGSLAEVWGIVGNYAGRILRGEKPGDLPVQLVTQIRMAVNLKTAKALGLTVPLSILLRANEVIE
jgi:putative ABC transport system substrate-binding protein